MFTEILATVILPPGDVHSSGSRAEDIQVAIAVHIRRRDRYGSIKVAGNVVFAEVLAAVILPPDDVIGIISRAQDIQIAIAIQIDRRDRYGPIKVALDRLFLPVSAGASAILAADGELPVVGGGPNCFRTFNTR
jgi:hypothetical protein